MDEMRKIIKKYQKDKNTFVLAEKRKYTQYGIVYAHKI